MAERARDAAVTLVMASKETEPSLGVRLLADLKAVFGTADELPSKIILQKLVCIEEAPWADMRGKPLDERGLANRRGSIRSSPAQSGWRIQRRRATGERTHSTPGRGISPFHLTSPQQAKQTQQFSLWRMWRL